MPKQIYKIDQFHGGLNNNSDARDIDENELSVATDVMVDEIGKITMMGGIDAQGAAARTNQINPGYGLFQFSHDRVDGHTSVAAADDPETGADYFAFSEPDTAGTVDIYSAEDTTWGSPITGMTDNTGGLRKDAFYFVDGALRISDGEFGNTNVNKWYGYTYAKLFQTSGGTPELTLNQWSLQNQELKSFTDLSITVALDDCSAANPDATALVADKIILGWWTAEDGGWNGTYALGVTPVYIGGQEGPITDAGNITLFNQILNVQVYIGHPTIDNGTISSHPLNDNRIIGINLYIRSFPSDDWYILKEIDLKTGGKFGWSQYDDTHTAVGFWTDGDGADGSDASVNDSDGATVFNDGTAQSVAIRALASTDEYAETTMDLGVHGATNMGTGRTGTVRISGFESVIYREISLESTSAQIFTGSAPNAAIPVVNPSNGNKKKFTLEILDENYGLLKKSVQTIQIDVDADAEPPPTGGGDDDDGGYGGSGGST